VSLVVKNRLLLDVSASKPGIRAIREIGGLHSAFRIPHSAFETIRNLQSIRNPQSEIRNKKIPIDTPLDINTIHVHDVNAAFGARVPALCVCISIFFYNLTASPVASCK
jgi:hypothetical protein